MKYLIIGTAGHVDHGKSALIKALTGTDTDRLKEEKLRGISIDLGFASLALGKNFMAGIVDVPGHERFLKNMLAGTGGIDMVIMVIAADEGVMPQTREHLAMLHLYGVKKGVVAITKIDKVDAEWLDLIEEDVRGLLQGTFLAEAPLCRVSAVTGEGLEVLRQTLLTVAGSVHSRDSKAPFRMWIDRIFTVKGHGAVVTGSVLSGTAKIGDGLELCPARQEVRVRGLEWHGSKIGQIYAGQRAAINVAGVDIEEVKRGMSLSAPHYSQINTIWDVQVEWHQEPVPNGTRIRLHLGTGENLGRIYGFRDAPGRYMRIMLESPLAAGAGDKGIIRLYSPQHLLGGVMLIAPGKRSRKLGAHRIALAEAFAINDYSKVVQSLLAGHGMPMTIEEIGQRAGYVRNELIQDILTTLAAGKKVIMLANTFIDQQSLALLTEKLGRMVKKYHNEQPTRAGLSQEIVKQQLGLTDKNLDLLLASWQKSGMIVLTGGEVALKEHAAKHTDWQQDLVNKAEQALADIGLSNVDGPLLADRLKLPKEKAGVALENLTRQGVLVRVGDMHVYRKTIQYIAQLIQQHFQNNPTLSVAELRDMLTTSRKVALPLMEYLDMHKYTTRDGDVRRPGPKLQ